MLIQENKSKTLKSVLFNSKIIVKKAIGSLLINKEMSLEFKRKKTIVMNERKDILRKEYTIKLFKHALNKMEEQEQCLVNMLVERRSKMINLAFRFYLNLKSLVMIRKNISKFNTNFKFNYSNNYTKDLNSRSLKNICNSKSLNNTSTKMNNNLFTNNYDYETVVYDDRGLFNIIPRSTYKKNNVVNKEFNKNHNKTDLFNQKSKLRDNSFKYNNEKINNNKLEEFNKSSMNLFSNTNDFYKKDSNKIFEQCIVKVKEVRNKQRIMPKKLTEILN